MTNNPQKDISESYSFIEYLLNIGVDQLLITINNSTLLLW